MSVIEIVLAAALTTGLLLVAVPYFSNVNVMIRRHSMRSELTQETRNALDTMTQILRRGSADTVWICACSAHGTSAASPGCAACSGVTTGPPYSYITFTVRDFSNSTPVYHNYEFYYSNGQLLMTVDFNVTTTLCSHVTAVSFMPQGDDPSRVLISLRLDLKLDQSGKADRTETLLISNREVRMQPSRF